MERKISSLFSVTATLFVQLMGGWDGYTYILLLFMALDFASGLMCGAKKRTLSPVIAFNGATKKLMIILMVMLAVGADQIMQTSGAIRMLVIFYYSGTEGLSVIENASILGLPVPDKIKNVFASLTEDQN